MRLGIDEDRSSRGSLHVTTYLSDIPVVGRPGNPQRLTNLTDSVALVCSKRPQLHNLLGRQRVRPAKQPATLAGCRKPSVGSLPDEVTLHLRDGSEDMKDQLASA